ncbi:MAG: hypothetical protein L3K26_09115, partial [Candidatus Hydrogenedentes bacterium]|nr:hypothetical protein [Candidatus Hydrogenedentota bacterium]
DFPERVIRAMGAIAMACGFFGGHRARRIFPGIVFPDFLTYATLNYHNVPAFLHRKHADKMGALTVPIGLALRYLT